MDKTDESKWGMEVIEKDPIRLHVVLKVNIPVNAIVGRYLSRYYQNLFEHL